MLRTHTCGELRDTHIGQSVTLSGWVQRTRDLGGMTFLDLRDRYGITQVVFNMEHNAALCEQARKLGREFVVQVQGTVAERQSKNPQMPTGDIEIIASAVTVINPSKVPPFTIEAETDGGDELRMKYRYLDLRRGTVRENILLRHRMGIETTRYLDSEGFLEIETPFLIKSTPEGARDFIVPSRLNPNEFYALPQSPQTFKQLLMVSGFDKYFQIVRCFRDEDLRADRQPEFTQIDCEMSFVTQDDVLNTFEGLTRHLFSEVKGVKLGEFPRMKYDDAMAKYGSDKPDIRFGMTFTELDTLAKGKGFPVFDQAELVAGICAPGCAEFSRKQLDELTDWVKRPQVGAKGLVYVKMNADGTVKSSVDKFYSEADLRTWAEAMGASKGDLLLVMAGDRDATRKQLGQLRLKIGRELFKPFKIVNRSILLQKDNLYSMRIDGAKIIDDKCLIEVVSQYSSGNIELLKLEYSEIKTLYGEVGLKNRDDLNQLIKPDSRKNRHYFVLFDFGPGRFEVLETIRRRIVDSIVFEPLWVVDFPLLEWDPGTERFYAMHHPFTSPKPEDITKLDSDPGAVRANAYDLVINGVEIGGGSIRIHDRALQQRMFEVLGFTEEKAQQQFGFLMNAFEFGAPPHGGIAFGFDRLCALFGGQESIRDFIAFPKNNHGRDVMLDAPSPVDEEQLQELYLALKKP